MAAIPSVVLFCDQEESTKTAAQAICLELASRFGVTETTIRLTSVGASRLLHTLESLEKEFSYLLLVLLSNDTHAKAILETESSYPLLELDQSVPAEETAFAVAKWCGMSHPVVHKNVVQFMKTKQQASLVDDAQFHTRSPVYSEHIKIANERKKHVTGDKVTFSRSDPPVKARGKVRDRYELSNALALVTTDRQSGFDRQLAMVPYKGAVLNLTSAFWFEQTKHIIPNHLLSVPHPYVSIVKKCKPFPIEFVVRAYMTGSTSTSIWSNYQKGVRNYCGHILPDGMFKNQKLWATLLTPTTKEEDHDRPISADDVVKEGWMTEKDWHVCATAALEVFRRGQQIAAKHGLILVDTKYEFGRDLEDGTIRLIDEVHTPDSSRYWISSSYEERMEKGLEPENIDKEFLRLWFKENCDPYKDDVIPNAPKDLVEELARRYILLYEMITWKDFDFEGGEEDEIGEAIEESMLQEI